MVYVLFISYRKYGIKKMFQKLVDNTFFSIFAAVTNMSFFEISMDIKQIADNKTKNKQRSKSVPNLTNIQKTAYSRQRSVSLHVLSQIQTIVCQHHRFSRFQSNILYGLFCFGTMFIFCMDLGYQIVRNENATETTFSKRPGKECLKN